MNTLASGQRLIIDSAASKMLSKLIIRIGQPLLVLSAIMKVEYSKDNLLLGLETFLIGLAVYAVMALIASGNGGESALSDAEVKAAQLLFDSSNGFDDFVSKLYGEDNAVDMTKQQDNKTFYDSTVQELYKEYGDWATMWLKFWQKIGPYDENFMAVSEYAVNNNIRK